MMFDTDPANSEFKREFSFFSLSGADLLGRSRPYPKRRSAISTTILASVRAPCCPTTRTRTCCSMTPAAAAETPRTGLRGGLGSTARNFRYLGKSRVGYSRDAGASAVKQ